MRNLGLRGLGPKAKSEKTPTPSKAKTGGSTTADEGTIEEVNQREGVDEFLFNGDMILTDEQLAAFENELGNQTRQKRQVATYATRWTNNKVFYYFDATITTANQAYVRKQLKYLSDRTCITFVEDATATNRIKVFDGAGCYSSVGMRGGEQSLSLTNGCFVVGTVAHEFMHALGALHMQMRHDRDTYIRIDLTNVPLHVMVLQQRPNALMEECPIHEPAQHVSVRMATVELSVDSEVCCSGQLNQIRASNINPTPVVTYSLYYASTFTYQYRYV
ncbi:unnamed protein product [Haemonchus placei]|uniref:Metalloendopeptidase n=1 Tax=Haemonchus placei TaxID=6290 RepID=A0A3P7YS73_HAEPC|nr:unnamed protein product [Haemonchus placei]